MLLSGRKSDWRHLTQEGKKATPNENAKGLVMKRLLVASIMIVMLASSAMAQVVVGPEGIITHNGALHYVVPSPHYIYMGATPFGAYHYHMPLYPLSYPMVPVPIAPMWGTPDDIQPSSGPMQ